MLKSKKGRQVLLVAGDVYRPAAIDQLKVLGGQIGVEVYTEEGNKIRCRSPKMPSNTPVSTVSTS